jgi:hypothetical protein
MQDIQDPYLKNNPTHAKWAGRVAQVVEQAWGPEFKPQYYNNFS